MPGWEGRDCQTGSSFPDCPALGPGGLEKLADEDGIVCIPPARGEEPTAERPRKLAATAYGKDWRAGMELELIRATGSDASDLEEWLRNDFFEQHCDLFHQRPFIWHVWDGRKRNGFHALVNHHRLAAGDRGRRSLENLTHSYLGDWTTRQKDSLKREEEGGKNGLPQRSRSRSGWRRSWLGNRRSTSSSAGSPWRSRRMVGSRTSTMACG